MTRVLSLGGGLDSWAMLLDAELRGELPDVAAFVDVGDPDDRTTHPGEWEGTYRHIEEVVKPWCAARGIEFVEISARTGYNVRPDNQNTRSLFEWLWTMKQIPVSGPNRIPEPNSGCWLWFAGYFNWQEYGCFWFGGRMRGAHVVAYEALAGPIPERLVLDHTCRTTCCVNPAHLEPVTQRINTIRGTGFAGRANNTHCLNGHELVGDNLIAWHLKRGHRACRACRNAKINAKREAQRQQQVLPP